MLCLQNIFQLSLKYKMHIMNYSLLRNFGERYMLNYINLLHGAVIIPDILGYISQADGIIDSHIRKY